MRHKGLCWLVFAAMASNAAWSDEPVRRQTPLKQRVDPKLLREALALPEYRPQAPETPPVSLDDLQGLTDRLRKNGDSDGADLLERFIQEHQRLVKHSVRLTAIDEDVFEVQCKIVDVNLEDLPHHSTLRMSNPSEKWEEFQTEISHLVATRKAKVISEPILTTRANVSARLSSGGEFPVPKPGHAEKVSIEFREYGTMIEVLPTVINRDKIRLESNIELSEKDPVNTVTVLGTTVPSIAKQTIQGTVDVSLGQPSISSCLHTINGRRLFVIMSVSRRS